uniref:Target of rapamycin complex 2 subunit MAPKAP1 n=1 Tax=Otolemur garnettii TaxID=30611 RepID=H0XSN3_OTOGA
QTAANDCGDSARVQDLIGPICRQYTSEGWELKLNDKAAHGFSLIQVDNAKVTMEEILLKAVKYRLEKQILENSSREDWILKEDSQIDIATQDMLSNHHYKSFKVSTIHRLRFTTDVQLGISGDKVEIDPVTNQKASTKFWIKQKHISIDSNLLCACDLAEENSPSHAIFKLTYPSNHNYKHLYFELDAATITEIMLKVNYILESQASTAWAEYFAQKQRKPNRHTSFSFQKEKKSGQQ